MLLHKICQFALLCEQREERANEGVVVEGATAVVNFVLFTFFIFLVQQA